jgi:hypothetical protein
LTLKDGPCTNGQARGGDIAFDFGLGPDQYGAVADDVSFEPATHDQAAADDSFADYVSFFFRW